MRTKHLCVLIHGEVSTVNMFKPSSIFTERFNAVLLLWILFVIFGHFCLYYAVVSVPCNPVIICLEKDDLLALLCVTFSCAFVTFQ